MGCLVISKHFLCKDWVKIIQLIANHVFHWLAFLGFQLGMFFLCVEICFIPGFLSRGSHRHPILPLGDIRWQWWTARSTSNTLLERRWGKISGGGGSWCPGGRNLSWIPSKSAGFPNLNLCNTLPESNSSHLPGSRAPQKDPIVFQPSHVSGAKWMAVSFREFN